MEHARLGAHPAGQFSRRAVGDLGGLAVDDDDQQVDVFGKRAIERELVAAPADIGRQHALDIGVDAEMAGRVGAAGERQQQRGNGHRGGIAAGEVDDAGGDCGDHAALRRRALRRGKPPAAAMQPFHLNGNCEAPTDNLPRKLRARVTLRTCFTPTLRRISQAKRRGSWLHTQDAAAMSRASKICSPTR